MGVRLFRETTICTYNKRIGMHFGDSTSRHTSDVVRYLLDHLFRKPGRMTYLAALTTAQP